MNGRQSQSSQHALQGGIRAALMNEHREQTVELIETHISYLYLVKDFVYKLKKPVKLEFLDYSTPARRKAACEAEVAINRQLTTDVYLAVVPVARDPNGRWQLGGEGAAADWLVKMKRLPEARCLKHLIRGHSWTQRDLDDAIFHLIRFYRSLPAESVANYRDKYVRRINENLHELVDIRHGLPEGDVKRIHTAQLQFAFQNGRELDDRVQSGHVVEGHGDLRAEHLYLTSPPAIIDAIEFDRELRLVDIADELSFFAMTCDDAGATEIGDQVLRGCCEALIDFPSEKLIWFYKSYRACVRAKVAALRMDQTVSNAEANAQSEAKRLLNLAKSYSDRLGSPLAIIVRGFSGTGKSTFAQPLAAQLGCECLSTDRLRKSHGSSPHYDPQARQAIYRKLIEQSEQRIRAGFPVVVDGSFGDEQTLRTAIETLRSSGGVVQVVTCVCSSEIAIQRLRVRSQSANSLSDADEQVYRQQTEHAQDLPSDLVGTEIDTTLGLDGMLSRFRSQLKPK